MKVKLTMKNETYYRLRILEPTPSILDTLKDYWEKNNIDTDMYGEYDNAIDEINRELSFIDDKAKMYDFTKLSKYEFLKSYSYINEREYDATQYVYENMGKEEKETIDNITLADVKECENEPDITDEM